MSKKQKVENVNELFSQVLGKYGDLIPSKELRDNIAQNFIEEVEGYGVSFHLEEEKFPTKETKTSLEKETEKMVDDVKKERKQPPSASQSPTEASVHGQTMKAKHSDLLSGIKSAGKTNDK